MANITVIATNVYNDATTLQADLNKALTETIPQNQQQDYKNVISDVANLINDTISLLGASSGIAGNAALLANLQTIQSNWNKVSSEYNAGGISAVNAQQFFNLIGTTANTVFAATEPWATTNPLLATVAGVSGVIGAAAGVAAGAVSESTTLGNVGSNLKVTLNNAAAGELQFSDITGSLQATVIPGSVNSTGIVTPTTVNVSGDGSIGNIANANININSGASVQVYDMSGNAIFVGANATVNNVGRTSSAGGTPTQNTFQLNSGDTLTDANGGTANVIDETAGATGVNVNINGLSTTQIADLGTSQISSLSTADIVNLSSANIALGQGASANINGNNNQVNLNGNSSTANITGNTDSVRVNANSDTVNTNGINDFTASFGDGLNLTAAGAYTVNNNSNVIDGNNDVVNITASNAGVIQWGNHSTITLAGVGDGILDQDIDDQSKNNIELLKTAFKNLSLEIDAGLHQSTRLIAGHSAINRMNPNFGSFILSRFNCSSIDLSRISI